MFAKLGIYKLRKRNDVQQRFRNLGISKYEFWKSELAANWNREDRCNFENPYIMNVKNDLKTKQKTIGNLEIAKSGILQL